MNRWVLLVVALSSLVGCGGAAGSKAYEPLQSPRSMPTRQQLQSMAAQPLPQVQDPGRVVVDDWAFEGQWMGPEGEAPKPLAELETTIGEAGATSTPALHCVAEQVARFHVAHGGLPSTRLASYMLARCGGFEQPMFGYSAVGVTIAEDAPDERFREALLPEAKKGFPKEMSGGRAGSWIHREGDKATLAFAYLKETVSLRIGAPHESGMVTIDGKLRMNAPAASTQLVAYVNQGGLGVAPCDVKRNGASFQLGCRLAEGDEQAWVQVLLRRSEHLLATAVGRALVHREGPSKILFPKLERTAPVTTPDALRATVLAEVNAARQQANMRPLVLAPAQSLSLDALTPHFAAAMNNQDEAALDQLTLGTAAGWDITSGIIRDAGVVFSFSGRHDAQSWLAAARDQPIARSVLFDPEADELALGAAFDKPLPGVGTIIATYKFFKPETREADGKAVLAALNAARTANGVAPAIMLGSHPALEKAANRIATGVHPSEALDDALGEIAYAKRRGISGQMAITGDPAQTPVLPELASLPSVGVHVKVIHHHLEGEHWGFYLVLIAADEGAAAPTMAGASRPAL